jgi:hypothetical protein
MQQDRLRTSQVSPPASRPHPAQWQRMGSPADVVKLCCLGSPGTPTVPGAGCLPISKAQEPQRRACEGPARPREPHRIRAFQGRQHPSPKLRKSQRMAEIRRVFAANPFPVGTVWLRTAQFSKQRRTLLHPSRPSTPSSSPSTSSSSSPSSSSSSSPSSSSSNAPALASHPAPQSSSSSKGSRQPAASSPTRTSPEPSKPHSSSASETPQPRARGPRPDPTTPGKTRQKPTPPRPPSAPPATQHSTPNTQHPTLNTQHPPSRRPPQPPLPPVV